MRRDFRGRTEGNETEIVEGDLVDIEACDAVLADFTEPDEGTSMEAWHAHAIGRPVVVWTGGRKPHPWTVFVAAAVCDELEDAGLVVSRKQGREKLHYLNPVPIRLIHDRWIDKYTEHRVAALADLKNELEETA